MDKCNPIHTNAFENFQCIPVTDKAVHPFLIHSPLVSLMLQYRYPGIFSPSEYSNFPKEKDIDDWVIIDDTSFKRIDRDDKNVSEKICNSDESSTTS